MKPYNFKGKYYSTLVVAPRLTLGDTRESLNKYLSIKFRDWFNMSASVNIEEFRVSCSKGVFIDSEHILEPLVEG
jgi:hypothetical protein